MPRLILTHNLHGIDIDLRAVQIAQLALWLRAQRRYGELKIKIRQRPHIKNIHIVCAEPMPGEYDLLGEFTHDLQPAALGNMLFEIWQAMTLTGEAGSLLKIETTIRGTIDKTRRALEALPEAFQLRLFGTDRPKQLSLPLQRTDLDDTAFWENAEARVVEALRDFSRKATDENRVLRRLFTDDALQGMAFIDILRQPAYQKRPVRCFYRARVGVIATRRLSRRDHQPDRVLPWQLPKVARGNPVERIELHYDGRSRLWRAGYGDGRDGGLCDAEATHYR